MNYTGGPDVGGETFSIKTSSTILLSGATFTGLDVVGQTLLMKTKITVLSGATFIGLDVVGQTFLIKTRITVSTGATLL